MKNKILLDCTFRDGGYYNKWNFDLDLFQEYLKSMSVCKVDIVEIGFRFNMKNEYLGPFAFTTEDFLNKIFLPNNLKYAVMINAKEFYGQEKQINKIFIKKSKSKVDLVRIAINFNEYKNSFKIIQILKKLGYEVGLNLMQSHDKSKENLIDTINDIIKWNLNIDYLYFADSLGCMDSKYVGFITTILKDNWNGKIGIHAHNNKSMALSNTLHSLKSGAGICDSTILGMGRGAGNAQTEFLLQELKGPLKNKQLISINKIINKFNILKTQYGWGYNFLYFYAANNKIHPTYIQTFLSEKRYTEVQILNLLQHLSKKDLLSFSQSKINEIFYESYSELTNIKKTNLNKIKGNNALILGNGNSVLKNLDKIKKLLKTKKYTSIFLNKNQYIQNKELADLTVVVNNFRLLSDLSELSTGNLNLIAPINKFKKKFNIKFKNKNIKNYPVCIKKQTFVANENYTILPSDLAINYALSICKILKFKNIFLIGIDGYQDIEKNNEIINSIELFKKNFEDIDIYVPQDSFIRNNKLKYINDIFL